MGNTSSEFRHIQDETKLNRIEVERLHQDFVKLKDKNKKVDKTVFGQQFTKYLGLYDNDYANKLFDAIDLDGSGDIDFREFAIYCGLLIKGTFESKVDLAFRVWDLDGSGSLQYEELLEILIKYMKLMKKIASSRDVHELDASDKKYITEWATKIFETFDTNKDGALSREEFRTAILDDKTEQGLREVINFCTMTCV